MTITFYHNPDCGTSRNALAIVRAHGDTAQTITIIEYLKAPHTRERLARLYSAADRRSV